MKKIYFIPIIMCLLISTLSAITTPRSIAFSDSYGLRAIGSDALYWNPASLSAKHASLDIPLVNFQFRVDNNGLTIQTYNKVSGQYLDDELKNEILSGLNGQLGFGCDLHTTILGITFKQIGIGLGVNAAGSGKISEQYLKLLLFGNEEDDEITFNQEHNDAEGIVYSDFTIGYGDLEITKLIPSYAEHNLPPVEFGVSISFLTGIKGFEVSSFNGHFSAGDDGVELMQDVAVNEGTLGYGFKGMFGLKSQVMDNLLVGLTFDNLMGHINWNGDNKKHLAHVEVDSVYVSDLEEDIFEPTDTVFTMGSFKTKLPAEMNMSFLYNLKKVSVSLDWKQGFKESFITSSQPRIALGLEYSPISTLPLQIGYSLPNKMEPYRFSYGFGVRSHHFEFGLAVQSSHSVVPCNLSRGVSIALHSRVLY